MILFKRVLLVLFVFSMSSVLLASEKMNDLERLFREGSCPNGNFRDMEIKNLTIKKNANLQGADFTGAKLYNCRFGDANFENSKFVGAEMNNV